MAKKKHLGVSKLLIICLILVAITAAVCVYLGYKNTGVSADITTKDKYVSGQILVKFKDNVNKERKDRFLAEFNLKEKSEIAHTGVKVLRLPGTGTEKVYERVFKLNKDIEFAELDYLAEAELIPNDPGYPNQWYETKIVAPAAWDKTTGNANIIIAILDTGINPTHPDLKANLIPGWNVASNNSDTSDINGHGTSVSSAAGAVINNSIGMAGVCGNCKIMPVRITNDPTSYASWSTIATGVTWAADHGARIISNSYMSFQSSSVSSAAKYFQSKGGLMFAASGNDNALLSNYDDPNIIVVGGTDTLDNRASFSNYGKIVDITAPATNLYLATNAGSYGYFGGTSGATPITAGTAALMYSLNPSLPALQVESMLKSATDDLGAPGWDQYFGWGRVNAQKAVEAALNGPPPDITAPTVTFMTPMNGQTVSGTLAVKIEAKDNTFVNNATLSLDGITNYVPISTQVISDTDKIYNYSIDTNLITNGSHTLNAKATDNSTNTGSANITINIYNTVDTIAPTVTIISPINGTIVRGSKTTITATATDNVAVTRVDLFIDGVLQKTFTAIPYSFSWNIKKISSGAHTIYAKAYDAKGNVGTSSTISVSK